MSLRPGTSACGNDATLTWRRPLIETGGAVSNSSQDKYLRPEYTSMRLAFMSSCVHVDAIREATASLAGLEKNPVDPVSF